MGRNNFDNFIDPSTVDIPSEMEYLSKSIRRNTYGKITNLDVIMDTGIGFSIGNIPLELIDGNPRLALLQSACAIAYGAMRLSLAYDRFKANPMNKSPERRTLVNFLKDLPYL